MDEEQEDEAAKMYREARECDHPDAVNLDSIQWCPTCGGLRDIEEGPAWAVPAILCPTDW